MCRDAIPATTAARNAHDPLIQTDLRVPELMTMTNRKITVLKTIVFSQTPNIMFNPATT
jgi:hypothetical protein